MNWKDVRVLVTGAGGFIGSHLTEELARRGAKVRALVRYNSRNHWGFLEELDEGLARRVEVRPGDVTDSGLVRELVRGQEVVFHLAALISIPYSYAAPESFVAVNVRGTLNILEACRRHRTAKLVHTSTSEVYGTALYTPIDEGHPLQGQSPYSASKIGADHMCESYHRSFDLPVAIARPFNTYGPRQSARAVIPAILTQLLAGAKALRLGSLGPARDFNFVEDTVEGFLAVAAERSTVGQAVNLGSGTAVRIEQVVRLSQRLLGAKVPVVLERARVRPARSEVRLLLCDNRKARRMLRWKPGFSLEEGLVRTADYLRLHLKRYKTHLYNI
ncbi:MAG: SDR family NAD(P)-dependent oxidoreductase [Elusimicrobia bacterium]|nr:SDR family NAD(P)-dependent oxidoreductase [Elusimicrobiota bacterium]